MLCVGSGSSGQEFIIGFMTNFQRKAAVEIQITSMGTTNVQVNVSTPKWGNSRVNERFELVPGASKTLLVTKLLRSGITTDNTKKSYKGVHISADGNIQVISGL